MTSRSSRSSWACGGPKNSAPSPARPHHRLAQGTRTQLARPGQHPPQALGRLLALRLPVRAQRRGRQSRGRREATGRQWQRGLDTGARRRASPQVVGRSSGRHGEGHPRPDDFGHAALLNDEFQRTAHGAFMETSVYSERATSQLRHFARLHKVFIFATSLLAGIASAILVYQAWKS